MLVPAVALGFTLLLAQAEEARDTPKSRLHDLLPPAVQEEAEQRPGEALPPEAQEEAEQRPGEALAPAPPAEEAVPPPPLLQPPASPLPVQEWGVRTVCMKLQPTQEVPSGRWRAQCDSTTQRCIVSPEHELDFDGVESERPVERVLPCHGEVYLGREELAKLRTYRFEPAIAEAPPGWYRDERGRVMQFNFDLNRRIWLGGAWAPLGRYGEEPESRFRADFGIQFEVADDERSLHRVRLLETEVYLGEPRFDTTLLRYDFSIERRNPLFRVTTFFGEPERHDIHINLGLWTELLRVEELERGTQEAGFLTWGAFHATLDLWHSRDLVSYVRLRAGPSLERDYKNGFNTLVPGAALEGDLTLDRDGFHHLRFGAEAERVLLAEEVEGRPESPDRLKVYANYEVILLAINDQPVSFLVDGRGAWRNDIPNVPATWEWSASAGLRFSLWAPARRTAPMASAAKE